MESLKNDMSIRVFEHTSPKRTGESLTIQDGPLTITPILVSDNSEFGAEVSGVNWNDPVPANIVSQVRPARSHMMKDEKLISRQLVNLQNRYGVLIFRKTGLENARHIAFSQQLGDKLEINPFFYGRENDRLGEPLLFDVGK